jgi:hypothetical protein
VGDVLCQGREFGFGSDGTGAGAGTSSRTRDRYAVANRVCRAFPNAQQEFVCYDMAPTTNLTAYFLEYVDLVLANPGCDGISEDFWTSGSGSNITEWEADYHEVESCFRREEFTDCTHGYRSSSFDSVVMMPPAMYTTLGGPFLVDEEDTDDDDDDEVGEEDSAFCIGSALSLWGSLLALGWFLC